MELDEWHGPIGAICTQQGDIFDITVFLPCKIDGHLRKVRVVGIGTEMTKVIVDVFTPQSNADIGLGLDRDP